MEHSDLFATIFKAQFHHTLTTLYDELPPTLKEYDGLEAILESVTA